MFYFLISGVNYKQSLIYTTYTLTHSQSSDFNIYFIYKHNLADHLVY